MTAATYHTEIAVRAPMRERYGEALRHRRRVRLARWALPFLSVAVFFIYSASGLIGSFLRQNVQIDLESLDLVGDTLVMELPKLSGFNKMNEAYLVTAASATQRVSQPGKVELVQLKATIQNQDQTNSELTATNGLYDSSAETLMLTDGVTLTSTRGYSARLQQANVSFKARTVQSDAPVTVTLSNNVIDGNRLDMEQGGDVIRFSGGVRAVFQSTSRTSGVGSAP